MDDGALDVYYTPVMMKKSRPAYQLTLLCKIVDRLFFEQKILTETSTFGVRTTLMDRSILNRSFCTISTSKGPLKIKCGYFDQRLVKVTPEYESVKLLSEVNRISFMAMYNYCIGVIQERYQLI